MNPTSCFLIAMDCLGQGVFMAFVSEEDVVLSLLPYDYTTCHVTMRDGIQVQVDELCPSKSKYPEHHQKWFQHIKGELQNRMVKVSEATSVEWENENLYFYNEKHEVIKTEFNANATQAKLAKYRLVFTSLSLP